MNARQIGKKLREERNKRGFSSSLTAGMLGKCKTQLLKYETSTGNVKLQSIIDYLEMFNLELVIQNKA